MQLRDLLQKAGLRDLEREATYAIEHGKTSHQLAAWKENWKENLLTVVGGGVKIAAFEWSTAYGLHPERALLLILVFWFLFTLVYIWPIWRTPRRPNQGWGIYRVIPGDRIEIRVWGPEIDNKAKVERLQYRNWRTITYAMYFSLVSAFNIGFREFNVGNWIVRLQRHEYTLRPVGWVRSVAGAQSLLSVYLLALWVLTYFGRPFQ